jgi:hypothetical protein
MQQIDEAMASGEIEYIEPFNILMNIVGMCIFPFIARAIFFKEDVQEPEFVALMNNRRLMIPKWIDAMLQVPNIDKKNQ